MQFWAILRGSIKMTLRNRQALFWTFFFPVMLMMLLGVAFSDTDQAASAKLSITVEKSGDLPDAVVSALRKIDAFEVSVHSKDRGIEGVKEGDFDAALVIPAEWSKVPSESTPATIYASRSSLGRGDIVASAVSQVLGEMNREITKTPLLLAVERKGVDSNEQSYLYFLLPGIVAMALMTSGIIGISQTIVFWRKEGILRRIRLTPLPLWQFLSARVVTQLMLAILQAGVLILIGRFVFGVELTGNLFLALALVVTGSLAFITIGFTMSSFSNSPETAGAIANVVTLPMMFLGGVFFPVNGVPQWVAPIINLIPLKYLADGLREVMIQGAGFAQITTDLAFLAAVTAIFFVLSIRLFRWE